MIIQMGFYFVWHLFFAVCNYFVPAAITRKLFIYKTRAMGKGFTFLLVIFWIRVHRNSTLTRGAMAWAVLALGSQEVIEEIVAFCDFFEQTVPLAASCSATWHVLRLPLQDHAHNIRQYRDHQNMNWLHEIEIQQRALESDPVFWLIADASRTWHFNDGQ